MNNNDLENRLRRLEEAFEAFSKDLRFAYQYMQPDAASSLTKSRVVLEKLIKQIYIAEMGREPKKPLLGDILADNRYTRKIDRRILSRMNAIRDLANLGAHGEHVVANDATRALDDLAEVLDWYLQRSEKIESRLDSRPPIEPARPTVPVIQIQPYIHGWTTQQVQALQQQTAQAFGLAVELHDKLKDNSQGPLVVVIPGGRFLMGSPAGESERDNDERQHEVEVAPFAIGKYAATIGQFRRFVKVTGYQTEAEKGGGCYYWTGSEWKQDPDKNWRNPGFSQTDNHPVVGVNWNDAIDYADWLSEQTGQQYRLPTEAEWEYACRAGTTTPFYFGKTMSTEQANYNGNYIYNEGRKGVFRQKTVEAGQFPVNAWGLHDMHGNVWEWTCSVYDEDYGGGEQRCAEPGTGGPCVLRGGSWFLAPKRLRGAARSFRPPHTRYTYGGFRLARTFSL